MVTRVKVCGLMQEQDVDLAVELGAHAVGFVMESSSPRCVSPSRLVELCKRIPPFVTSVAVFGPSPSGHAGPCQAVQCFAPMPPGSRWIQALRVGPDDSPETLRSKISAEAEAVVLDALVKGAFGGTGVPVDWGMAAEFVAMVAKPVILAGGLTPENVKEAVSRVRPFAVDVSSGIELAPGRKDPGKMRAFLQAAMG